MDGIPKGLCQCGCGGKTTIAKQSHTAKGHVNGEPKKYIFGHHRNQRKGENSYMWKGGRSINKGYAYIYIPEHPRSNIRGYVLESVLIAEKALGKPLPPKAIVHHINGGKADNRPENLVVCQDQAYHMLLHQRQRAYDACGHANWRICRVCHRYDDPDNLVIYYTHALHRVCRNESQNLKRQTAKEALHG